MPEELGQRRLSAIAFTDVKSYSKHMATDEASTLAKVREDFAYMKERVGAHGGQVLKSTGDGLMLQFDSASAAVNCAREVQEAFAARRQRDPSADFLEHRIGIHLGDVYEQDGDVHGDGVNVAARLEPLAEPGGICISQTVYDVNRAEVAAIAEYIGQPPLKNIHNPLSVYRIQIQGGETSRWNFEQRLQTVARKGEYQDDTVLSREASEDQKKYLRFASNLSETEINRLTREQASQVITELQRQPTRRGGTRRVLLALAVLLVGGVAYGTKNVWIDKVRPLVSDRTIEPNSGSTSAENKHATSAGSLPRVRGLRNASLEPAHFQPGYFYVIRRSIVADANDETHYLIDLRKGKEQPTRRYKVPHEVYMYLKTGDALRPSFNPSDNPHWKLWEKKP